MGLALVACRSETKVAEPTPDVSVPRLPAATPEKEAGGTAMTISTGKGWMLKPEQAIPAYVERAEAVAALQAAPAVVLVAYDALAEECSGMGGSHAFFTFVERTGVVHFGGHGAHLGIAFTRKGELWVAAIDVLAKPESVKNEMWCVPDRMIDARATAMIPVASADEGRQILRDLGK